MNLFTTQKHTHGHRKQTETYQRGQWWREGEGDKLRVYVQWMQTTIYKIDKQQTPFVQYRKLYSPQGCKESDTTEATQHSRVYIYIYI